MSRPRVAFVVQRYGADITGGSETLARVVAEKLCGGYEVDVFTTCARDYLTWRNELPAGEQRLNGVRVRRFAVGEARDLAAFNAFAEPLYRRGPTRDEEIEFLRRQGPYVPALVEALSAEREGYAAFVFFTYLYYPSYWGLQAVPERSILVPTTHDEPPLRFSVYRDVFARPRAFGFLTPAEERLVRERFDVGTRPTAVVAMGVEVSEPGEVAAFRRQHDLEGPYLLYAGRIDEGKGCGEMVRFHQAYRRLIPEPAELVLIGTLALPGPLPAGVRHLGFLSEQDKATAMAGARAIVCSSPYESLSIVLLEGLSLGTPGLVNGRSAVLREHCLRSNAGLFYEDSDEYAEAVDLLVRNVELREKLGAAGRRYVEGEYRWNVVLDRWRALLDAVAAPEW